MIRRRAKFSAVPVAVAAKAVPNTPADDSNPGPSPPNNPVIPDTLSSLTSSSSGSENPKSSTKELNVQPTPPASGASESVVDKSSISTAVESAPSDLSSEKSIALTSPPEKPTAPFPPYIRRARTKLTPIAALTGATVSAKDTDSRPPVNVIQTMQKVPNPGSVVNQKVIAAKSSEASSIQVEADSIQVAAPVVGKENRSNARLDPGAEDSEAPINTSDKTTIEPKATPVTFRRGKFKFAPKVVGGATQGTSPSRKTEIPVSNLSSSPGTSALTPSSRHTNSTAEVNSVEASLHNRSPSATNVSNESSVSATTVDAPPKTSADSSNETQGETLSPVPANLFQRRPKSRLLPAGVKLNIAQSIKARRVAQTVEKQDSKPGKSVTFSEDLVQSSSIKDPSTQSEITAEPQEETLTSSTEHTTKPEENPATSQLQTSSEQGIRDAFDQNEEIDDVKEALKKKQRHVPALINMQELKSKRSSLTLADMITCKVRDAKRMDPKCVVEDPDMGDVMRAQLNRRHIKKLDTNATEYVTFDPIKKEFIELTKREPTDGSVISKTEVPEPNNNDSTEPGIPVESSSVAEENSAIFAPRLKMGEDGRFVLDEESLVIEQTSELSVSSGVVTQASSLPLGTYQKSLYHFDYRNTKGLAIKWSESELKRFYMAVQMVGLDFQMLLTLIPDRSYKEIRSKFSAIDKTQSSFADKLLSRPLKYDQMLLKSRYKAELRNMSRENYEKRRLKLQFEAKRRNDREHFKEWFLERDFQAEAIELQKVRDEQEKNIGRKRKRVNKHNDGQQGGESATKKIKNGKNKGLLTQEVLEKVASIDENGDSVLPDETEVKPGLETAEDPCTTSPIIAYVSVGGVKRAKRKSSGGRTSVSSKLTNQSAIQQSIEAALERYNLYKNSPQKLVNMADQILQTYPNSLLDSAESDMDATCSTSQQSPTSSKVSQLPPVASHPHSAAGSPQGPTPSLDPIPENPAEGPSTVGEPEAATGITVEVQCKKAKRKKKVKLKTEVFSMEPPQLKLSEVVSQTSMQSETTVPAPQDTSTSSEKPAKKKKVIKNQSAVKPARKSKRSKPVVADCQSKDITGDKTKAATPNEATQSHTPEKGSPNGPKRSSTGTEASCLPLERVEGETTVPEDVPLPFSPTSVLRSVEETPDLASILRTPKRTERNENTTPKRSSNQESSNDISTRSPPEISLAKSLQSAHVTTDDVTVAHDVTISDEVTRSEMGLASARDSSNQEESSRVPTSECTSPDVIPRLKQRKSAAFVGSTLEMLEASSLEDVNEQSCDLAALGFVDCVPSVPKRAKPVEPMQASDNVAEPISNEEALESLNHALTSLQNEAGKQSYQAKTNSPRANSPEKQASSGAELSTEDFSTALGFSSAIPCYQKNGSTEGHNQETNHEGDADNAKQRETLPDLVFVNCSSSEPSVEKTPNVAAPITSNPPESLPELGFLGFETNQHIHSKKPNGSVQKPSGLGEPFPDLGFVDFNSIEVSMKVKPDTGNRKKLKANDTWPDLGIGNVKTSGFSASKKSDREAQSNSNKNASNLGFVGHAASEHHSKNTPVAAVQNSSNGEDLLPDLGFGGCDANELLTKNKPNAVVQNDSIESTVPNLGFCGSNQSNSLAKKSTLETRGTSKATSNLGFFGCEASEKSNTETQNSTKEASEPLGFDFNRSEPAKDNLDIEKMKRISNSNEPFPSLGFAGFNLPSMKKNLEMNVPTASSNEESLPNLGFVGFRSEKSIVKEKLHRKTQSTSINDETSSALGFNCYDAGRNITSSPVKRSKHLQSEVDNGFLTGTSSGNPIRGEHPQSRNSESQGAKQPETEVKSQTEKQSLEVSHVSSIDIDAENLTEMENIDAALRNCLGNGAILDISSSNPETLGQGCDESPGPKSEEKQNAQSSVDNGQVMECSDEVPAHGNDNQTGESFPIPDRIPSPPPIPENGEIGLIVLPEKLPFAFYFDGVNMIPGLVSVPGKESGTESQDESETDVSLVIDEDCNKESATDDVINCDDNETQAAENDATYQPATSSQPFNPSSIPSLIYRESDEALVSEIVEEEEMVDEVVVDEEVLSCDEVETEVTSQDGYESSCVTKSSLDEPFIPKIKRRRDQENFDHEDYDSMSENNFTVRH